MSTAAYDHTAYSSLLGVGDASEKFIACGADNAVDGKLKDVLVKHKLTDKFGISLLHSHAEIQPHERLTHFGNSALPVSTKETSPSTLFPCTWKVTANGLLPLEFFFSASNPQPALTKPTELAFVEEIRQAIIDLGLQDLIGFSLLANKGTGGHLSGVEVSEGRCNITLPPDAFQEQVEGEGWADALWIFNPIGHKKCKKTCKTRPEGHRSIHQTTNK